jgi:hypothetical protein
MRFSRTRPGCLGSRAAVRPRGAEGPQHFQYPTTCCTAAHRGFVPGADSCTATNLLFDYLVGATQEDRRHVEANRLRDLEIDHHLESDGLLDRQIARLGAASGCRGLWTLRRKRCLPRPIKWSNRAAFCCNALVRFCADAMRRTKAASVFLTLLCP